MSIGINWHIRLCFKVQLRLWLFFRTFCCKIVLFRYRVGVFDRCLFSEKYPYFYIIKRTKPFQFFRKNIWPSDQFWLRRLWLCLPSIQNFPQKLLRISRCSFFFWAANAKNIGTEGVVLSSRQDLLKQKRMRAMTFRLQIRCLKDLTINVMF